MFVVKQQEINWGGKKLSLETGRIARQADGAVLAKLGGTEVLCTVCTEQTPREGVDFLPLGVHYQEKSYAAGRVPGGFFKREGRPSEKEILTSRLIDRPLRPLFPKGWRREVQVLCTVLGHDLENDPDIVAMIGSSAALAVSGIPFAGPIAGARVGYQDGKYILNPTIEELTTSSLNLVVAGVKDGVLMVESEASELTEEIMLGAVLFGHKEMQPVLKAIEALAKDVGKAPEAPAAPNALAGEVDALLRKASIEKKVAKAYTEKDKILRQQNLATVKEDFSKDLSDEQKKVFPAAFKSLESEVVRSWVLKEKKRIDGRGLADVRQIVCEVGFLEQTHGSALFTRGETQALVTATLGTGQDEQIIDAIAGEYREHFLLHYNFPPYSVGEVSMRLAPGRREIGHGKLAWRALRALMPKKEEFPYTIRLASEITESNGSSSMATVCGCSLALMDAGAPLARPVAGIAMGLIKEGDDFAILSDILGDEDHLGDMDFKVAGTKEGITALQMDIKITSISSKIMEQALAQAHQGRLGILDKMSGSLDTARTDVNVKAPRIVTIKIPKDKIRELIGPGGKMIREICETTGARIDVDDEGVVKIAATGETAMKDAVARVDGITASPEVGKIYKGKVVKTTDFGAFISFLGPRDGLVHISELSPERVAQVEDVVREGDQVRVKCIGLEQNRIRLSMRRVDQKTGKDLE